MAPPRRGRDPPSTSSSARRVPARWLRKIASFIVSSASVGGQVRGGRAARGRDPGRRRGRRPRRARRRGLEIVNGQDADERSLRAGARGRRRDHAGRAVRGDDPRARTAGDATRAARAARRLRVSRGDGRGRRPGGAGGHRRWVAPRRRRRRLDLERGVRRPLRRARPGKERRRTRRSESVPTPAPETHQEQLAATRHGRDADRQWTRRGDAAAATRTVRGDGVGRRYKKESLRNHPDRGGDADAFDALRVAYGVLSDPQQRRDYDHAADSVDFEKAMALIKAAGRPIDLQLVAPLAAEPSEASSPRSPTSPG